MFTTYQYVKSGQFGVCASDQIVIRGARRYFGGQIEVREIGRFATQAEAAAEARKMAGWAKAQKQEEKFSHLN